MSLQNFSLDQSWQQSSLSSCDSGSPLKTQFYLQHHSHGIVFWSLVVLSLLSCRKKTCIVDETSRYSRDPVKQAARVYKQINVTEALSNTQSSSLECLIQHSGINQLYLDMHLK